MLRHAAFALVAALLLAGCGKKDPNSPIGTWVFIPSENMPAEALAGIPPEVRGKFDEPAFELEFEANGDGRGVIKDPRRSGLGFLERFKWEQKDGAILITGGGDAKNAPDMRIRDGKLVLKHPSAPQELVLRRK